MELSKEIITPEIAEDWLKLNQDNRPLNDKHVHWLKLQMLSGQYKVTGDPIQFSKSNRLLDGQHRLTAIVLSKKPQEMAIARNLDDDVFDVLDTGKNRSASDLVALKGFKRPNDLQAIAKFVLQFEMGAYYFNHARRSAGAKITNQVVLNFVMEHEEMPEIVEFIAKDVYRKIRALSIGNLGGLYMIVAKKNQEKADEFFSKLGSGLDIDSTSPIYILREKFITDVTRQRKLPTLDKIAMLIKAWNAFVQDKKILDIRQLPNEQFPKFV